MGHGVGPGRQEEAHMAKRLGRNSDPVEEVRRHVIALLEGGHAHATFDQAIKGLPPELRGKVPKGLPYSPWQLLEHLRIAQADIVGFSQHADHVSPTWPDGYWPTDGQPTEA